MVTLFTGKEEKLGFNYYEDGDMVDFSQKRHHKIEQKDIFKKQTRSEEAAVSSKEAEEKVMYIEYRMVEHCDLKHVLNMVHTFKFDFKTVRFLGKDAARVWD